MPAVAEHLTAKYYVDQAISNSVDESSVLKLDPDEKLKLVEQNSIIPNSTLTSPKTKKFLPKLMLIPYAKTIGIHLICLQYLRIKIMILITTS